jgi:hypothetical protein
MTDVTTELGDLATDAVALPALERLANRELSWLDFNERVLALAEDPALPLFERVRFVAIVASNLDEFYQVRVASLRKQEVAAPTLLSPDGLDATTQLRLIGERVAALSLRHARFFTHDLKPRLARAGIRVLRWRHLSADEQAELAARFVDEMLPVLTPLAVDPSHPFPFISNLSLNLAVWLKDPAERETRFARVKVPAILSRFVKLGDGLGLVPLEDVIAANLELLFPGMAIASRYPFRVTRASDLEIDDDDAEDLLRAIEAELQRHRTNPVVRLEVARRMPGHLVHLLTRELHLDPVHVHRLGGILGLTDVRALTDAARPDLSYPAFVPAIPPDLARDASRGQSMLAAWAYRYSSQVSTDFPDAIRSGQVDVAVLNEPHYSRYLADYADRGASSLPASARTRGVMNPRSRSSQPDPEREQGWALAPLPRARTHRPGCAARLGLWMVKRMSSVPSCRPVVQTRSRAFIATAAAALGRIRPAIWCVPW